MEDKKDAIEELKKESIRKQKRKKEMLMGIGAIAIISIGIIGFQTLFDSGIEVGKKDQGPQYSEVIKVASGIQPYRTEIQSNETVKFTNTRDRKVVISFQTGGINERLKIKPNQSAYFNASEYEDIPEVNYFTTREGDTGELVVE